MSRPVLELQPETIHCWMKKNSNDLQKAAYCVESLLLKLKLCRTSPLQAEKHKRAEPRPVWQCHNKGLISWSVWISKLFFFFFLKTGANGRNIRWTLSFLEETWLSIISHQPQIIIKKSKTFTNFVFNVWIQTYEKNVSLKTDLRWTLKVESG